MENLTAAHQALIKQHPCFAVIAAQHQNEIIRSAQLKLLNKGEYLLRRGDEPSAYYGVAKGRIKVSAMNDQGKSLTLKFLQTGDWFGEISLIDGIARTHDCEAIEPCEIIMIAKPAFESYVLNDINGLKALTLQLCQRLRTTMNLAEQASIQTLEERLATRLLELHKGGQSLNINQQDIAHMLGVSRQSVSKLLLQWSQNGWIKIDYNQIIILSSEHLLALCKSLSVPQE